MTPQLYHVVASSEFVVEASDENDANELADELALDRIDIAVSAINRVDQVPEDWLNMRPLTYEPTPNGPTCQEVLEGLTPERQLQMWADENGIDEAAMAALKEILEA